MDISRKTDYALRMLSMLAEGEDSLLSVRTAAETVDGRILLPAPFSTVWCRRGLSRACAVSAAACGLKSTPKM